MKRVSLFLISLITILLVTGCATRSQNAWYYFKSNLNTLSIGVEKTELLAVFSSTDAEGHSFVPLIIKATKEIKGELIEVGEIRMMEKATKRKTNYWFLFVNGKLAQWGEPRDWKDVKNQYEITFNPSPSVSY